MQSGFWHTIRQDHSGTQVTSSRSCRFPQEDESGCVFGCNNSVPQGVDECGLRQEALAWCFHVHADSFFLHGDAATTASINVSLSDLCQSEILDFWFAVLMSASPFGEGA